ncbi:MAG TPA: NAD(P)/FAD-dependent oxidoreductase [Candidatus Limivivens merdigallinarum]|uniref:NAD(P)/FAD-dependent oxidoreductase n=1 Tax=Candidatus Limivivens merdigallinarum TaxID=2840859 RepID=A0A9D0ZX73_9FIRM|nr:NAD(P)/FAD-dependent oxidoreductase [Candidatus Limivivens merdigallinarum]
MGNSGYNKSRRMIRKQEGIMSENDGKKVIVIGGGAAGMFAAVTAAGRGKEVTLYEKNEKLGKKLYITGKGRCNLTNACDVEELFQNVCTNPKFLYSAFYGFDNQQAIDFFETHGMRTKTERGGRVFPLSDHSSDVIGTLVRAMTELGVKVCLNQEVRELLIEEQTVVGVLLADGRKQYADRVIVTTGGLSYPSTGSTGDGYRFAREAGHKVTELSPSLVPMNVLEEDAKRLQGLSLKNVEVTLSAGKKKLYQGFGEMMFTHFGVTGPLILSASSFVAKKYQGQPLSLSIDLKPALSVEQLDGRLLREFGEAKNRQFKNTLSSLFPAKLIPIMIERSQIAPEKRIHEISREERRNFIEKIKKFQLTVTGLRDYNESIITRGGVSVKEIHPSTMESKLVANLFFAGEVLDVDALTGGFNLQIAWSTGYAAGMGV